jgi:hypothetical protein
MDTPMNRRHILKAGAAGAGLAALSTLGSARAAATAPDAAPAVGSAEDQRLNALFETMLADQLAHSPEMATSLGVDSGAHAGAKARLDDRSLHAWEDAKARTASDLAALRKIDAAKLTGNNRWNLASILYSTQLNDTMNRSFATVGSPYVVSQLTGCYQQIPDFLDSQHTIADAADADAYLSRLDAFATAIDQDSAAVRHDVAAGVIPPDFILAKALTQLKRCAMCPPRSPTWSPRSPTAPLRSILPAPGTSAPKPSWRAACSPRSIARSPCSKACCPKQSTPPALPAFPRARNSIACRCKAIPPATWRPTRSIAPGWT